jgi:nucleotide-binding universal stress UspA family protein
MAMDDRASADAETTWPERVVVGVDDSPEASLALERALELAMRAGSTVVVVHAVGLLEGAGYRREFDLDEMIAKANARVGCPAELLAPPIKEVGPPADVLERVVERVGGDLIVVGRRGSGVAWRPLGSTSEGVLTRASVPVLVVSRH